jgi:hypothetical protein
LTKSQTIQITHVAGLVAPVNKTVTYGTVINNPGEPSKCRMTSNLGADHQADSVDDATEASAGWYWQFNLKQGYKHDGTNRTPNTAWISWISESSDWTLTNDPCVIELGSGWRIPTYSEWYNIKIPGGWTNWNGPWNSGLKMHAGGSLNFMDGSIEYQGLAGVLWNHDQSQANDANNLTINHGYCGANNQWKTFGFFIRCVGDF